MDNNKLLIIFFGTLILLSLFSEGVNVFSLDQNLKSIDKLYGPEGFITVDNKMMGDKYNLTYGELTGEGMGKIVKFLESANVKPNNTTFIDLGCGNGKTLAYATVYGFKQARGAEIVEARYEYAERKRKELEQRMRDRISISKSDIFKLPSAYFPKGSVIFISNLLFPEETNQQLIKFLSETIPSDTIIILSKIPTNLYKLKLIEKMHVPMSWSYNSECYILKK